MEEQYECMECGARYSEKITICEKCGCEVVDMDSWQYKQNSWIGHGYDEFFGERYPQLLEDTKIDDNEYDELIRDYEELSEKMRR